MPEEAYHMVPPHEEPGAQEREEGGGINNVGIYQGLFLMSTCVQGRP